MAITLSYPKPRDLLTKVVVLNVSDSSTEKCVLPKDAIITDVICNQTANATTNASTWVLGWSGTTGAILNAFASATTKVGQVHPGVKIGDSVLTKLDSDKTVISTCTPGASDTTSVVYAIINYFVPGPGETATS
jgi:hypothetical protein